MPETELLINILEDETFLEDKRDLEAAEIHARRFATAEPITDDREAGEVADAVADLQLAVDAAERHRKATTKPWWDSKQHVDSHYKELGRKPEAALQALKRKALAFKQARDQRVAREQREDQERREREAEEKAAEVQAAAELVAEEPSNPEAREIQAQAREDAKRAAAATLSAPPTPPTKQVRGSVGKVGSRTEYRHTVVDRNALPADYLIENDKAIKAAIKGERAMAKAQGRPFNHDLIPGVQIVAEEIPIGGSAVRS